MAGCRSKPDSGRTLAGNPDSRVELPGRPELDLLPEFVISTPEENEITVQTINRFLVAATLFLAVLPASGQANIQKPAADTQPDLINPDRPGIADGSGVVGKRRFQIETAIQKEFRSDAGSTEHRLFVPTLIRFGFDDKWEARIEGNTYTWTRTFDPTSGISRTDGYSPMSFGAKYHWQDSKGPGHPSLGTIFRLFVPSGSSNFGSHRFQGDWRLAADQDLTRDGSWSLNPNVGIGVYDDGQSGVFATGLFAVTLNYFNKAKTLNPFIDTGVQAPEEKRGRTSVIVDTGIAYIVNPNVQLDVSVGTGILGRTPPHPFWAVGISIRR